LGRNTAGVAARRAASPAPALAWSLVVLIVFAKAEPAAARAPGSIPTPKPAPCVHSVLPPLWPPSMASNDAAVLGSRQAPSRHAAHTQCARTIQQTTQRNRRAAQLSARPSLSCANRSILGRCGARGRSCGTSGRAGGSGRAAPPRGTAARHRRWCRMMGWPHAPTHRLSPAAPYRALQPARIPCKRWIGGLRLTATRAA